MKVLVLVEGEAGEVAETSLQAITAARALGQIEAVTTSALGEAAPALASHGVAIEHRMEGPLLDDYAPEAWAESMVQLVAEVGPGAVMAAGSERGNEVMAHVGARMDLPMAANVTTISPDSEPWQITRIRWGGSLLEEATLAAPVKLLTVAPHAVPAAAATASGSATRQTFTPQLEELLGRTKVRDRVTLTEGITLATAPVVVSGGRGMGSAESFALLDELAALVGGAVGCSRVATNNGWRSHSDQIGQTGTRVAPELYVACGISGAIQHWVGMMASKRVLAINTDAEAPMVTKSDYAVIGDALEILPAIIAEIGRRRA